MPTVGHPNPSIQPAPGSVPHVPGVYRWRDRTGRLLYVGKAKLLDARIASYFRDPSELHPRTVRMLTEAALVEWVVCSTEAEALVLERSWIAAEQPPFNVALRNGDGYAGVAITSGEHPRLIGWRGKPPAGTTWFGPYPNVRSSEVIDSLCSVFPVRTCNEATFKRHAALGRGCLLAETGRCSAPCVGPAEASTHATAVKDLTRFLSGRNRNVIDTLETEMNTAAEQERFELAARRRDQRDGLVRVLSRQMAVTGCRDLTAVGIADESANSSALDSSLVGVAVVIVRSGEIRGVHTSYASVDTTAEDGLVQAVMLALAAVPDRPPVLLLPTSLLGHSSATFLGQASASSVDDLKKDQKASPAPRAPRNDVEHAVMGFADRNAENALSLARLRRGSDSTAATKALDELQDVLDIPTSPRRIECIDISHTQGRHPVASIVVGINGSPTPGEYRRVNIPSELGGDDPGSIRHALYRRLTGTRCGMPELPDLFLIDGGSMQAEAAQSVIDEVFAGLSERPVVVGLAKRLEELWIPGQGDPIILARNSGGLTLVQTLRDEAHRWAITGHRRQRDKAALRVRLDDVPGLGTTRRRALLERFESLDGISRASIEELSSCAGIGPSLAQRIWDLYHP